MNGGAAQRITIDTPITYRDEPPAAVDIVIIGGGVIGVFAALYLSRAGKSVLLCEKGRIAGEQSSRNWGWIRQLGRDEDELPVMTHALSLWRDVDAELKGACGFVQSGVNYLSQSETAQEANEDWCKIAVAKGLKPKRLSRREVGAMFSDASDSRWVGGVQMPSDARGEPWVAVPAVARLASASGAFIRENCAVRMLERTAGKLSGIITEDGAVRCDQVVLAGGAWSSVLCRNEGVDLPQLSVRATVAATAPMANFFDSAAADEQLALRRRADGGYSLAVTDKHGFYIGPDAFRHFGVYLPQLRESWRDSDFHPAAPAGFPDAWRAQRSWTADQTTPFERIRVLEPTPDKKYLKRMRKRFAERFPGIGAPTLTHAWAGMIDAMPDVVPVVDRAPALDGLIIATGMCGHGFGIGPGFGRVIARMATGQMAEHDLTRFRFSRFTDGGKLKLGPAL